MNNSNFDKSKDQLEQEILLLKKEISDLKAENSLWKSVDNLSEKEQLFESIFKEAGIGIGIIDKNLKVIKYNKSFYDLFGYIPEELKDKTYLDLVPEHKRKSAENIIKSLFNSEFEKHVTETAFLTKEQNEIWMKLIATVIKNGDGEPEFILGMGEDITDRIDANKSLKKAKDKAEESDRLKTAFLTNMSHEIRTPMNAIIGFSELIAEPNTDQQSRKEFAEQIYDSSNALLKLIDDIIDMSQLDSGNLTPKLRRFNLSSVLSDIYSDYEAELEKVQNKTELLIHNPFGDSVAYIETDEFRFKQIFSHLLNNAFKYTDKGFIEFGYDINQYDEPTFYVRDTGIGIAEEKIDAIFKHFTKIEDRTNLYRGTGIGLSITQKMVNILGGKIWVESNLGVGSTFYFTLPNKVQLLEINHTKKTTANNTYNWLGKNILIAEDEESNYEVIRATLARTHASINWVKNGEDAVKTCLENDFDLVLMDIKMPVLDGINATQQIKKLKPQLPIIAQTAFVHKNERDLCLEAGCDEYIPKPIKGHVLLDLISKFLTTGKHNQA